MEGEKTPSPTRVDELDGLIRLLACIKEMGWNRAFEDDVRYGNTKFGSSHLYTDPLHFLCDALAALQDSMFCMKTLNKVRSLLEKKIRTIKRRCDPLALEDGMRRLPDELLARIFEIGHLSTRSCTSLLVSHVSFRFRQVAIRTRLLWTRLSAGYTNDQLQAFVSRSGNLDLEIMCRSPPRERNDFLKVVISLSNRWSSAIISSPPLAKLISAAGSTSFRNLKYIYSDYSFDLREWSMPFLSHCVGRCLVINKQNLSQITSLELCFWKDDLDIPELAETLYQAKNLQDLSFRFMDYKFYSVHQPSLKAVEIPPPHSFSTKALKLLITGGQHSFVGHVMQPLNSVLTYISPLKVDISLENADVQCLYNTTGEIFPHGSTIQLRITRVCFLFDILAELVRHCDIARTMHFDAPAGCLSAKGMETYNWADVASIRHLRFLNCEQLCEEDVKIMASNLFFDDPSVGLQSLELISCKNLSEDFLLHLNDDVGDRVYWSF